MQSEWLIIARSAGKAALEPLDSPGSIKLCLQQSWAQLSINSAQINLLPSLVPCFVGAVKVEKVEKTQQNQPPLSGLESLLVRRREIQWPGFQRGPQKEGVKCQCLCTSWLLGVAANWEKKELELEQHPLVPGAMFVQSLDGCAHRKKDL